MGQSQSTAALERRGHSADESMMVDDDRPVHESTVMSKFAVSAGSSGLRLDLNTTAKLKALVEISQNLGRALSVAEVLPKLLDSLFTIFPQADRGFIVLKTRERAGWCPRPSSIAARRRARTSASAARSSAA